MRRALVFTALGFVSATLALVPAVASADCNLSVNVAFSYPNAETSEVPLNAVFWAVPQDGFGAVSFRLDGVELPPLSNEDAGRFQFAPSEALAPGVHDIEISMAGTLGGQPLEGETLRLRVTAVDLAPVRAEATIEAVRYYPLVVTDGLVRYPDPNPAGEGCAHLASLDGCHDITPESLVRLDLSTSGNALGYLVEGAILPPSCRTYFPYEYAIGQAAPYEIRAILPTGLSPPRAFQGEVEGVPPRTPVDRIGPPSGNRADGVASESCSLQAGGADASSAELLLLAAAGVWVSRRRQR